MSGEVSNSASDLVESTDMVFYIIMLALIVCMGLYIAYDMDKRYASGSSSATVSSESTGSQKQVLEPVIVNIKEVDTVTVKPVAVIPATQNTSAAVVVEQIEQKKVVTTAVIPVKEATPAADTRTRDPIWSPSQLSKPSSSAPGAVAKAAPTPTAVSTPTPTPTAVSTASLPFAGSAMQAAEDITAPATASVKQIAKTMTSSVIDAAPVAQAVQAYSPFPNSYDQPQPQYDNSYQNSYYQSQPQYDNSYQNSYYQSQPQYGNPNQNSYYQPQPQYGNPYQPEPQYSNPYANPYGSYKNMGSSDLLTKPSVEGKKTTTQQPAAQ